MMLAVSKINKALSTVSGAPEELKSVTDTKKDQQLQDKVARRNGIDGKKRVV